MSALNGTKVAIARMHASTHIQGIGTVGPVLDANSGKVLGALALTYFDGGCLVEGKGVRAYIPGGNIISMQFESET